MANRLIFKDKELKDITNHALGISGENEQELLVFCFEDGFVDGTCYLELEFLNGKKCWIELEKKEESYELEVKNSLLRFEGAVKMQLKIVQGSAVWKSVVFEMHVLEAINAVETLEEDYSCFVDWAKIRMEEIEEGFEQLDEKVNGIEVPTKLSDLENDVGFSDFSGDYEDLRNKPEIPSVEGLASEAYVDERLGEIESLLREV